jgi:signal transduction histidine kinase
MRGMCTPTPPQHPSTEPKVVSRLFLRIQVWFWLALAAVIAAVAVGLFVVQPDVLASWRVIGEGAIRTIGTNAAAAYENQGQAAAESLLASTSQETGLRMSLFAGDGHEVAGSLPADERELIGRAFALGKSERITGTGDVLLARRVQASSGSQYVIVLEAPSRLRAPGLQAQFFNGRFLLVPVVSFLILVGGVVCLWLARNIARPIRTLRTAAQEFSQGNLSVRVGKNSELRRGDEHAELGQDFDQMAARIEQLVKAQQQLLADISHELRSPLARLSLALDLARRRLGEEVPEHRRMEREVQRLDDLIGHLLILARLQVEPNNTQLEAVDLRELLHEVADDARFEAEAAHRRVVVTGDCDATVKGSRVLLRSAIENVVRNAVRHTPENSAVSIEMKREDGSRRLVIAVRDHGPGVPQQTLPRLFDPFFRVDEARDRDTGGVGLGLAIVRQAMLLHGGNTTAQNLPEGGLLIQMELP